MRLDILDHGHSTRNRVAIKIMAALAGGEPDDVIKTSLYRPRFFGRPWIKLLRFVMRGQSEWTPGERELFAAFTSQLNTCPFCIGVHIRTTGLTYDKTMTVERLTNWREAGFEARIAAVLELLEKVTLSPKEVGPADIATVREAGVSDAAIEDALHVCFVFNLVNRLANALEYDFGSEANALKTATILNRIGYQVPGFLLR